MDALVLMRGIIRVSKLHITLVCSLWWLSVLCHAQPLKKLNISGGFNVFRPTFVYFNEESFESSMPGFQLWINKEIFLKEKWAVAGGIGYNLNSFNAKRDLGSIISIKQIDFGYFSFEAGPLYKKEITQVNFWISIAPRVSRLLSENYSEYYTLPSLSRMDVGVNLKVGIHFTGVPMRPLIVANYYQGLKKVAENYVVSGSGQSLNDFIRNRSFGVQIGFYLYSKP